MIDLPTIPALAEAACVNYPAEWWYPAVRVGRGGGLPKDALVAVEICQTCPVREDCLRQDCCRATRGAPSAPPPSAFTHPSVASPPRCG